MRAAHCFFYQTVVEAFLSRSNDIHANQLLLLYEKNCVNFNTTGDQTTLGEYFLSVCVKNNLFCNLVENVFR